MRLSLYYEAQPYLINQPWGVLNLDALGRNIYARFGFALHNGVDIAHGYNSRLRAPFPYQFHAKLWQPNGGGLVLTIVSKFAYDGPDGEPAHVMLDLMHLAKVLKTDGEGETGDLIAIAGNTGFSTGPHTHLKYTWVRRKGASWADVEKNDADNTFDPIPFYTGIAAVDYRAPQAPDLPPVSPDISLELYPVVQAAKASLEALLASPEASRPLILSLWQRVLEAISRALTKG